MRLEGELIDDDGKRVKVRGEVKGQTRGIVEIAPEKGWRKYAPTGELTVVLYDCEVKAVE